MRALRTQFEGAWYHIMNRGAGHQGIFFTPHHYLKFIEILDEVIQLHGIEVHAYCLMGNHFHLIVHTPEGDISTPMQYLLAGYTRYINFCLKRDGPIFRDRFKSIIVDSQCYLLTLSAYIHRNPVKDGFCTDLDNYRWSSYHAYQGRPSLLKGLTTDEIERRFKHRQFKGDYKQFVLTGDYYAIERYMDKVQSHYILGGESFIRSVIAEFPSESLQADFLRKQLQEQADAESQLTIEDIIKAAVDHYGITEDAIKMRGVGNKNTVLTVVMVLARQCTRMKVKEIAAYFGNMDPSYASKRIRAAKQDPSIQAAVNFLLLRCQTPKR